MCVRGEGNKSIPAFKGRHNNRGGPFLCHLTFSFYYYERQARFFRRFSVSFRVREFWAGHFMQLTAKMCEIVKCSAKFYNSLESVVVWWIDFLNDEGECRQMSPHGIVCAHLATCCHFKCTVPAASVKIRFGGTSPEKWHLLQRPPVQLFSQ